MEKEERAESSQILHRIRRRNSTIPCSGGSQGDHRDRSFGMETFESREKTGEQDCPWLPRFCRA
jgi:hypothetical protein